MHIMRVIVGVVKNVDREDTKKSWKIRREQPALFLFLDNINSLSQKFKMIKARRVFTAEELKLGIKQGNLRYSQYNGISGKIDFCVPKEYEGVVIEKRKEE